MNGEGLWSRMSISGTKTMRFAAATAIAVASIVAPPSTHHVAHAAAPGEYRSPDWLPLRGTHRVGCTNGNGCANGYHGYAAIDLEATRGEAVYAAGAGRVIAVRRGGSNCPDDVPPFTCTPAQYANYVEIDHGGGVVTRYLHFDTVDVQVDDWVDQNTRLGGAGDTGPATPGFVHVHFEKVVDGVKVDAGPLVGCVGGSLVTYPTTWGASSWSGVTAFTKSVASTTTACGPAGGGPTRRVPGEASVSSDGSALVGAIGTDGTLALRGRNDGAWSSLGRPAQLQGSPSLTWADGQLFSGAIATDGGLYVRARTDAGWTSLGRPTPFQGTPSLTWADGQLFAAAIGTDGNMYVQSRRDVDNTWAGTWTSLGRPIGAPLQGSPTLAWADGTLFAVAIGTDGEAYVRTRTDTPDAWATNWTGLDRPGSAALQGSPAAGWADGQLFVAAIATNGTLTVRSRADASDVWTTTWTTLDRPAVTTLQSSPSLASADGQLFVGVIGADGAAYLRARTDNDNAWAGTWITIGTPGSALRGSPSLTWAANALNVTAIGTDGSAYLRARTDADDSWGTGWTVLGRLAAGLNPQRPSTAAAGVPSAARNVTASLASGTLTVRWDPPASSGASPITSYVVSIAPGDTATVTGGTSATFTSVPRGTLLSAVVTAVSAAGSSPPALSTTVANDVSPSALSLQPARLLDTRSGPSETTIDGRFQGVGPLAAGTSTELDVAGRGGVPATADAVMLNVTAISPAAAGYLTVYPCGQPVPLSSNLNFRPGDIVPNAVLAKIGTGGKVCIYTSATTQLAIDVNGHIPAGGSPKSLLPARLLDTRIGSTETTVDRRFEGVGVRPAGTYTELEVAGRGGIPADADAVMLNVTVVTPDTAGFVTVYPCGQAIPLTSNLNFLPGDIVPNAVLAKIGTGGKVCIYTSATTQLAVDVNGYIPAGGSPRSLLPARLLDTRNGSTETTIDRRYEAGGALVGNTVTELEVAGRGGIPADADAVMLNVTAISPAIAGFLSVYPCGQPVPLSSNLNFQPGDIVPNAVLAKIGTGGKICIYTSATTHLAIDINGYGSPT